MASLLDLISTPVPVLGSMGLRTDVGLSGDDPLSERHTDERYEVQVSVFDPEGRFCERIDVGHVGPGDRRMIAVSDLVAPHVGDGDALAVVHRVPTSAATRALEPSAFHLYRSMVQLSRPGAGAGSVIYETPPGLNDRRRGRMSTALMFSSKVLVGGGADTSVCVLHHSIDPDYSRSARLRLRVHDDTGVSLATEEREIGPFRVEVIDVRSLLARAGHDTARARTCSVIGWSRDAALVFLFVQTSAGGGVAVEHSHPPQTYLLPEDISRRFTIKDAAITAWDDAFESERHG